MFVALGAYLLQADEIAHQLMQPGEAVYQEVVRHFGPGILDPDGRVNRPRLAEAAFGSGGETDGGPPSRVQELNQIVHPAVVRKQEEWMEEVGRRDPHSIALVEAALILEAGAAQSFDRLVVVDLPARTAHRTLGAPVERGPGDSAARGNAPNGGSVFGRKRRSRPPIM